MPITTELSVMLTFISAPSRDFTVRTGPLTASMAPRMRTVAGACADAAVANRDEAASKAASAHGNNDETLMIVPFCEFWLWQCTEYPAVAGVFLNDGAVTSSNVP